jgi:hypothetical protein
MWYNGTNVSIVGKEFNLGNKKKASVTNTMTFFGNKVAQSGHIVSKKKLKSPFLYNRFRACCPNIA